MLEPLILEHITPGSTIITDCWKAYNNLGAEGFHHLTVNHSYNFVDPATGAHTNTVENLWWQIKRQLLDTHTCTDNWTLHLCEYMYRQHQKGTNLFAQFLSDAAQSYPA